MRINIGNDNSICDTFYTIKNTRYDSSSKYGASVDEYDGASGSSTLAFKQKFEVIGGVCSITDTYVSCYDSQNNNKACTAYANGQIRCNYISNCCYIDPSSGKEICY